MSTGLAGLARVRHEHLNLGGDLCILLSIAEPLSCTALHPKFVLYVLDPEPELFAIATAHMYSRYGYEFTEGSEPSMRHVAIVGVGHDPALYDANAYGFDAAKLRDLGESTFVMTKEASYKLWAHKLSHRPRRCCQSPAASRVMNARFSAAH